MAKRRETVVAEYVEAYLEVQTYKRQLAADPTRAESRIWRGLFNDAKVTADTLLRGMRGGDLGMAQRLIREREAARLRVDA
jgi:hypothetical protein